MNIFSTVQFRRISSTYLEETTRIYCNNILEASNYACSLLEDDNFCCLYIMFELDDGGFVNPGIFKRNNPPILVRGRSFDKTSDNISDYYLPRGHKEYSIEDAKPAIRLAAFRAIKDFKKLQLEQ